MLNSSQKSLASSSMCGTSDHITSFTATLALHYILSPAIYFTALHQAIRLKTNTLKSHQTIRICPLWFDIPMNRNISDGIGYKYKSCLSNVRDWVQCHESGFSEWCECHLTETFHWCPKAIYRALHICYWCENIKRHSTVHVKDLKNYSIKPLASKCVVGREIRMAFTHKHSHEYYMISCLLCGINTMTPVVLVACVQHILSCLHFAY